MPIETPQEVAKAEVQGAIEGGEWLVAKFLDGKTERILVRVPLRRFQDYVDNGGDVAAIVAIACNKPLEWTDGLTDESSFELFASARRTTDPRVASWVKTLNQEAEKLRAKKAAAITSPESAPGS